MRVLGGKKAYEARAVDVIGEGRGGVNVAVLYEKSKGAAWRIGIANLRHRVATWLGFGTLEGCLNQLKRCLITRYRDAPSACSVGLYRYGTRV